MFTAMALSTYELRFIPRADDAEYSVIAGALTVTLPHEGQLGPYYNLFPAVSP